MLEASVITCWHTHRSHEDENTCWNSVRLALGLYQMRGFLVSVPAWNAWDSRFPVWKRTRLSFWASCSTRKECGAHGKADPCQLGSQRGQHNQRPIHMNERRSKQIFDWPGNSDSPSISRIIQSNESGPGNVIISVSSVGISSKPTRPTEYTFGHRYWKARCCLFGGCWLWNLTSHRMCSICTFFCVFPFDLSCCKSNTLAETPLQAEKWSKTSLVPTGLMQYLPGRRFDLAVQGTITII